MPIHVSGTLEEIRSRLMAMYAITQYRKYSGWPLFQTDEVWDYESQNDARVCPVCLSFVGGYMGHQIPIMFPHYKTWDKAHVKPGTHIDYPELKPAVAPDAHGGCRCNLWWPDYLFVLTSRLFAELEAT